MEAVKRRTKNHLSDEESQWFDKMIQAIRLDSLYLESGIASQAVKDFYKPFFEGDTLKIAHQSRRLAHELLTKRILLDYLSEVFKNQKAQIQQIAFNLSGSDLLVWAVIADDAEEDEDKLFLAEAKINAEWHNYNYNISTTIVEQSDTIPLPSQYQALNLKT